MKKLVIVPVLIGLVFMLLSCAGAPKGALKEKDNQKNEALVIDHKNKALGGAVPDWVFASVFDLEGQPKYKDSYVFKMETDGKDKDGALTFLRGMEVPTQVARQVSIRVQNKFVGAQVGDKDKVETYMENVTKSLAQAQVTGLREVDNYWVKLQEGKADPYYRAIALYVVPKAEIDSAIARALDAENQKTKPKTEEEKVARDRVKNVFGEGMD
jgi:hypothetical protein